MAETERHMTIGKHRIHVFADTQSLVDTLTTELHQLLSISITRQQRFYLSLAGGTTPKQLYRTLAHDTRFTAQHWQQLEVCFGDERYVSHDDPQSNYKMVTEAWFDYVLIPKNQIHPIPTDCKNVEDCAILYAQQLTNIPQQHGLPCFDLMLLGIGEDGHTASLFPDTPVLNEQTKWAASVYVAKYSSQRITLTYPVINHAKKVAVIATGEGKSVILKQIMRQPEANLPVQKIRNAHGIDWYLDVAAAAELN